MFKHRMILFIFLLSHFIIRCDKGLAPYLNQEKDHHAPSSQYGGDPTGFWIPDSLKPIEITLFDVSKIPSMVDSLILDSEMNGSYSFYPTSECSIMAVMSISPIVYMFGSTTPLHANAVIDTIKGNGTFHTIGDSILCLPVTSIHFDLDTLFYTVDENVLTLITKKNIFNYMQLIEIPVIFTFNLIRQDKLNI